MKDRGKDAAVPAIEAAVTEAVNGTVRWLLIMLLMALILGFVVGGVLDAFAGSYTVTTTPSMDAMLDYLLTRINGQRSARGEPALTADQLFQQLVRTTLGQHRAEFERWTRETACTAFQALSSADQNAIVAQLGGKSPCP